MRLTDRVAGLISSPLAVACAALLCLPHVSAQKAGQISRSMPPASILEQPARRGAQPTTLEAKGGAAFKWNDSLVTGVGGRLRAQLNDGSILSLGSSATLKVVQHDQRSQQSSFELTAGRVRAQVVRLARPDSKFEVRTNTAVCGVLGTDEIVDATDPTATVVIAISGIVVVRSSDPNIAGSVQLTAGQMTTVNQGRAPGQPRQATPQELANAVTDTDGSTNPEPQVGDLAPQTQIGQQITLDGRASSGGVGSVQSYLWSIPRRQFTSTDPVIVLDTTGWQPGEYIGTLTITSTDGRSATANFRFRLIGGDQGSPEQTIANIASAYEALQVRNFMNLFDRERYSGYAALEQSISQSFSNIQENRVFVRRVSGQTTPESGPGTNPTAIYQVDFEIRFTPKNTALPGAGNPAGGGSACTGVPGALGSISGSAGAVAAFVVLTGPGNFRSFAQTPNNNTSYACTGLPNGTYTIAPLRNGFSFSPPSRTVTISGGSPVTGVDFTAQPLTQVVREQASLRIESFQGRGWLITDIQGSLGSAGLVGIPGTTSPAFGNTPGVFGGLTPGGGGLSGFAVQAPGTFSVVGGGSGGTTTLTVTPQNGFIGPVTITFLLPPGVTVTGPNVINITGPEPISVQYTFTVAAGTQPGSVLIPFTVTSGSTSTTGTIQTQQGAVTLQVQPPLTVQVTGSGATAGAPLSFFGGGSASTTIQVSPNVPVTLTVAPGAGLTATLGALQNGVATVTINSTNSTLGPASVQVTANQTGSTATATTTIFVNRNSPFVNPTGPAGNVAVSPGQPATVTINVPFAAGFTGPVVVTPPVISGLVFTPASVTLNASGGATFTATATGPEVLPLRRGSSDVVIGGSFTIQSGSFSTQVALNFDVLPGFDFTITGGTLTLGQGGTLSLNVVVAQTQGSTPQTVTVSAQGVPAGLTVTGGGTVNGSGSVAFSVAAAGNAALGSLSFTVQGVGPNNLTRTASVTVTVVSSGSFTLSAPSSVSIFDGSTGTVAVQVVPAANFNSPVAMTASGNGATVTGPSTIAAGASGDYTVTPTSNSGSVTFTGTALGVTQTVTVSFTRNAGFSISGDAVNGFLGGTFTTTVTITRTGNNGAITVTSIAAPSGVTVTPQSVSVPAGGASATFTVQVGNSALGGNINFSAVAAGGTVQVSGATTLTLGNPFSLTAGPLTGLAGTSTNLVITVTRAAGFTAAVDVALGGGTASGITSSPSLVTVGPGQTQASFVVTLGANATSGTLSFNGTSAGLTFTAGVTVALTVSPSFTISAPSNLPDLTAGGTQTTSVAVTFGAGFTGPVGLSASGTGGVTAVLAPTTFTGSGSAILTVGAPLGVSGAQSVTVTGTFGSIIRTVNIIVNVVAPPATFTATGAPVNIPRGFAGTVTIVVTAQAGFVGTISVAAPAPLPTGVTAVIISGPSTLNGSGNFAFNVTAAGNAPANTSLNFTLTGPLGSIGVPVTVTFVDPYTLTLTAPATLIAGTSGSFSAQVAAVSGVIGSVQLTPGVTPAGGATFFPTSITVAAAPSTTAIFSMTASASALGANNTNGSATASVNTSITGPGGTFTLNQVAAATTVTPAFSAVAAVSPVTVFRGTSTNIVVNVTFNTAIGGGVTATAGTLPTGITAVSSAGPIFATGTLNLSADVSATAPATATLPILVTGNGATQTVNISVNFQDPFTVAPVSPVSIFVGTTGNVVIPITINAPGAVVAGALPNALPTGFTGGGAPAPATLSVNGSFSYPVTANVGAVSGTGTFPIVAGSFTVNVNVTLNPVAPFTASAITPTANVFRGLSSNVGVNVAFSVPISGGVTASAGTLPPGISSATVQVSATIFATGTFTIAVAASPTAPAGPVTLPINVTGAGITQTVNFTINFQDPFTVAPVSPVNIFLGTSGSVTATVTFAAGFSGSVVVTSPANLTGAPGFSGGFASPTFLSGSGNVTYTVTAPSTAASGTAVLTFSANAFSTTVNVTLNAVPTFTAVAVTPNVNMFYGGSVSLTISVTYASGFTGSVGHTNISSLPCCFSVTDVAPPGEILNASGNIIHAFTDVGDHAIPLTLPPVTFRVSDLSGVTFVDVTFNVTLVAPFSLSFVAPSAVGIGANGTLTVNVIGAAGFTGTVDVTPQDSSFTATFTPPSASVNIASNTVGTNFTVVFSGPTGTATLGANASSSGFFLSSNATNTTTITPVGGGTVQIAGSPTGAPGATVSIPVQLVLNSGVTADTLSFGVSLSPVGGAPALTGTGTSNPLNFSPGSLPAPNTIDRGVASAISILWSTAFSPVTGPNPVNVGNVTFTIPAGATAGQSYTVTVTGGSATLSPSTPVSIVSGASGTVFVGGAPPIQMSSLVMRSEDLTYTPSLPREGETVRFRTRISNRGAQSSEGLSLALMRGEAILASSKVDLDAGRTTTVELEWKAERGPTSDLRLALRGAPGVSIPLRNLAVAKRDDLAVARRDRATLTARNEDCAGFRLRSASQSSCGGSADLEFLPVITAAGTIEVRVNLPDGGINDMGAMPLGSGSAATLPQDVSLQSQGLFVEGHTYLVRTRRGTALVRVARIRSTVNPRIAVITGSGSPVSGVGSGTGGNDRAGRTGTSKGLPTTPTDPLTDVRDQERGDRLLSNAQIIVDLEIILFEGAQ